MVRHHSVHESQDWWAWGRGWQVDCTATNASSNAGEALDEALHLAAYLNGCMFQYLILLLIIQKACLIIHFWCSKQTGYDKECFKNWEACVYNSEAEYFRLVSEECHGGKEIYICNMQEFHFWCFIQVYLGGHSVRQGPLLFQPLYNKSSWKPEFISPVYICDSLMSYVY